MRIAIAADHGGFEYKQQLIPLLLKWGHEIMDYGTYSEDSVDYPDYIGPLAKDVAKGYFDRGIVICGTGIGVSIVSNKVEGIRCALVSQVEVAKITREHNDSNILAMGARVIDFDTCQKITKTWLDTDFSKEERHIQRIEKISEFEKTKV
ncbi:MAG: ribose 5-phosphate isomerase B [Erysipelotrichaceae bacterium]